MDQLKKHYAAVLKQVGGWAATRFPELILFNVILIFLFLLRSVGYFDPYLLLTVNTIVMFGLIFSIFLLGTTSQAMFVVVLFFWLVAAFLRIVGVEIWAERTAVYAFQSLVIALVLLFAETLRLKFWRK